MKTGYVYILASKRNGTLYVGLTNELRRRVWEHKEKVTEGFTKKYCVDLLVWYEAHDNIEDAIYKEKQLKKWERAWKLRLIETENPAWEDLYDLITD